MGLVILANPIKLILPPQRETALGFQLVEMGSHVIGSKGTNVISSMPRLEVRETDRRVELMEDARRARPVVDAKKAGLREEVRRAKPRKAVKRLSSQIGLNVSLTAGVKESQTVPTSTPWRIFPSFKGGSSQ